MTGAVDPNTPVLVGVGQVTQRVDRWDDGQEAIDLMVEAVARAADDALGVHHGGSPPGGRSSADLLTSVQQVAVPQGTWAYADPARLLAERIGAPSARTVLAQLGVLQQDVIADACQKIAARQLDLALLVGGEAKHRSLLATIAGETATELTQAEGAVADRVWKAPSLGVHDLEILRHAVDPSTSYALIQDALRRASGAGLADSADAIAKVGQLWEGFASIAAEHPMAWDRSAPSSAAIIDPNAPGNRMIAEPYTKRLCSQWNVDQAVALVLCSVAEAKRQRIPRERWVFPLASSANNHDVAVVERADIARSPGALAASTAALRHAGLAIDGVSIIDLYSCFPAAVQVFADELGLSLDDPRRLTVTGGMTFFGGPLNSYALHALASMVPRLRIDPAAVGLSSSVSGFLVKQGFGLWSATPPVSGRAFRHLDVTADVAGSTAPRPVDANHPADRPAYDIAGASVIAATVVHDRSGPARTVSILDLPSGARTITVTPPP